MPAGEIVTLTELLAELEASGAISELINDPAAQFGTGELPYLGATLLPERLVDENMYKETQIRYRSFLAFAGSYYSPAQLSSTGELVGTFNVELGKVDIAAQVTAQDYTNLMKLLQRRQSREAILSAIRWFDRNLLRPHLDLAELQRWQAIIDAQVVRTGSNGYLETVDYPNAAGHRPAPISGGTVANPAGWDENDGSYDPMEDFYAIRDMFSRKGSRISRIITGGTKLLSKLGKNPQIRSRTSRVTINASGQVQSQAFGRASSAQINAILAEDGFPPIELYQKTYHTRANGEKLFVPDNKLVFIAGTGDTQSIDLAERGVLELPNTLGYLGRGVPAGQYQPGRVVNIEERKLYPGGYYGEAVDIILPVILHPENIALLTVNDPTP